MISCLKSLTPSPEIACKFSIKYQVLYIPYNISSLTTLFRPYIAFYYSIWKKYTSNHNIPTSRKHSLDFILEIQCSFTIHSPSLIYHDVVFFQYCCIIVSADFFYLWNILKQLLGKAHQFSIVLLLNV